MVPLAAIFHQQPPIATIRSILRNNVSEEGQQDIAAALSGVNESYKHDILKLFVAVVEQSGNEVSPDVWEIYYELKQPAKIRELQVASGAPQNVNYGLSNGESVIISESRNRLIEGGETGHRTWESSLALCDYLCTHVDQFSGILKSHSIIELGCGTGLVSLAIARLYAAQLHPLQVIASDGSPLIVQRLEEAIEQNSVGEHVVPRLVNWSDEEEVSSLPKGAVVFAGDILYGQESMYPTIIRMLDVLAPRRIFFCNPIRNADSYTRFKHMCVEHGYAVDVLHQWPGASRVDSEYMFIVSVPPIPVELIELRRAGVTHTL